MLTKNVGVIKTALVDLGYRKHNYEGSVTVHVVPRSLKKYRDSFKKAIEETKLH